LRTRSVSTSLADAVDGVVVEIVADDLQHHVERGGAAGAGKDIAVDLEQVGEDIDLREGFLEAGQVFPVDGAALVLKQAGGAERMGAGAQAADLDAAIVFLAQPCGKRLRLVALDVEAAADEYDRRPAFAEHQLALIVNGGVDADFDAAGRGDRLAGLAGQTPFIGFVAKHAVGCAQRFDGRGKRDHREFGHEVENDRFLGCRCVCHRPTIVPKQLLLSQSEQKTSLALSGQTKTVKRVDCCPAGRICEKPRLVEASRGISRAVDATVSP
jgi:hypothetical protein